MAQTYKYIVTVGNYPYYFKTVRSNSLKKAEKLKYKLSSEHKNQQVNLFEWDYVKNKWEHIDMMSCLSWAGSTITSEDTN